MKDIDAKIVERVRKLLARTTEAGCTEAEASVAFVKANALMAEYCLAMGDVEAGTEGRFVEVCVADFDRSKAEISFAAMICRDHFFIKPLLLRDDDGCHQLFFGSPTHVETARWVFTALLSAFDRLWADYRKANPGASRADRKTFIAGVYMGFNRKLYEERQAMVIERDALAGSRPGSGSTGRALALYSAELATAFAAQNEGRNLRKARSVNLGMGSGDALKAGHRAGESLELNRPMGGPGTVRQLEHKKS